MATHSSVLAWRIPGTEEPGGLPSMGSHRVGHNWRNLAAAAVIKTCENDLNETFYDSILNPGVFGVTKTVVSFMAQVLKQWDNWWSPKYLYWFHLYFHKTKLGDRAYVGPCCVLDHAAVSPVSVCSPVDCSPPGSSVHGIFQARVLELLPFPTDCLQPRGL